jgi:hypothetical protein
MNPRIQVNQAADEADNPATLRPPPGAAAVI